MGTNTEDDTEEDSPSHMDKDSNYEHEKEKKNDFGGVVEDNDAGGVIHDSSFPQKEGQTRTTHLVRSRVEVSSSLSLDVTCVSDEGEEIKEEEDEEEMKKLLPLPLPLPQPLGLYLSPIHYHSFRSLDNNILPNFPLLWRRLKKCCICQQNFTEKNGLVKCVSCGALAHRSCSFDDPQIHQHTMQICSVNSELIQKQQQQDDEELVFVKDDVPMPSSSAPEIELNEATEKKSIFGRICVSWRPNDNDDNGDDTNCDPDAERSPASINSEQRDSSTQHNLLRDDSDTAFSHTVGSSDNQDRQHKEDIVASSRSFASVATTLQENILLLFSNRQQQYTAVEQHESEHPKNNDEQQRNKKENEESSENSIEPTSNSMSFSISGVAVAAAAAFGIKNNGNDNNQEQNSNTDANSKNKDDDDASIQGILKEVDPHPQAPPPPSLLHTTYQIVQTSRSTKSKMQMASVAGGIAGGVAGLIISGPIGAIACSKIVQTASVVSVLLDGTVSIGVLMVGATAAKIAVDQVHKNQDDPGKRMIALQGSTKNENYNKPIMLVRPNVIIDPIWSQYTIEAKNHHPNIILQTRSSNNNPKKSFSLGQSLILNHQAKVADQAKRKRNKVDADIVYSNEDEIPTEEKVLLIVSRSLNDRLSLPGHVHDYLIQKCKTRADASASLVKNKSQENNNRQKTQTKIKETSGSDSNSISSDQDVQLQHYSRERRQDAHGVIKHVTATLIEIRPGLSATPRLTELTATAVEALVFGELYDLVFAEIKEEMIEKDSLLMQKIGEFEMNHYLKRKYYHQEQLQTGPKKEEEEEEDYPITGENISVGALEALLSIPEARTPVDKLAYCVRFLEMISVHFSNDTDHYDSNRNKSQDLQNRQKDRNEEDETTAAENDKKKKKKSGAQVMGADSLLKMVCEHIIVAKVPSLNAELVFLEEFARDEQLLRGKEGYSLVTLQASLHFLNASTDFNEDIFKNEE